MPRVLSPRPLCAAAFAPFGHIVSARPGLETRRVNLGTADRFCDLAPLVHLRPGAQPSLSIYRCAPWDPERLEVGLLERHPCSTQVFVPLGGAPRFLVTVALGGERPDPQSIVSFEVNGPVGIAYGPGTWHHPLVALDRQTEFLCLMWEDGSAHDCEVVDLAEQDRCRVVLRAALGDAPLGG